MILNLILWEKLKISHQKQSGNLKAIAYVSWCNWFDLKWDRVRERDSMSVVMHNVL